MTYNADPYIADKQSYTPLHNASEGGHVKVVDVLLQDGVDVNLQTASHRYTALHVAVLKNRDAVVELLLAHEGMV